MYFNIRGKVKGTTEAKEIIEIELNFTAHNVCYLHNPVVLIVYRKPNKHANFSPVNFSPF